MIKFDEKELLESTSGALKLRDRINEIIDNMWDKGIKNICWFGVGGTYASSMQAEAHMREKSSLDFFVENSNEYFVTGNKRITDDTLVVLSSVSGTTDDMIKALEILRKQTKATVLAFIDKENTPMEKYADYVISYPQNEQLKFFMVADRLMFREGVFPEYEEYYKEMDENLPQALVKTAYEAEEFAKKFAEDHHEDPIHYFVGAGNMYGATYSYAMCYWEEQHWLRTKSIHSGEFFHGMFEIVDRDTNVTLYVGEDSQRPLGERVANFLPRVTSRYTIIDTKDYTLPGISEKYRGSISHLVMKMINSRIDAHIERINCHPTEIRRYYRQLDY
ncbi:SIS domain-containing protein [Helcococcus kunzii]|uniref:SIS domain-containing protein n=1 Tax=Helcococcus kunzii TaxID=40091 RepID=UPI0024AD1A46|nr:SIS domain-containing protein [Helcococcus kunzii]